MMKPKLMIEPSSWLGSGVRLEQVGELRLFKFTDTLQARSDELLERNKNGHLTPEEQAELDGISELAQIFTYVNSVLASDSTWSLNPSENSLPKEPLSFANTAAHQKL
jgi:hypothetical protein